MRLFADAGDDDDADWTVSHFHRVLDVAKDAGVWRWRRIACR
jgi:hypothetical protein